MKEQSMTYKLELFPEKIISPVRLVLPNGDRQEYMNGKLISEQVFSENYWFLSIQSVGGKVETTVIPTASSDGNESFF